MTLSTGARFGHYGVQSLLGIGGMGEVCRALDTSLKRAVAITILPDVFASDPDRLARFECEAQTLAASKHAVGAVGVVQDQRQAADLDVEVFDCGGSESRGYFTEDAAVMRVPAWAHSATTVM